MAKQPELAFKMKAKQPNKDEFAESCRPLEELLDSLRDIEGFPIGKDEDILALSDPPYYTACPNPYINDFIMHYGKPYDAKTDKYKRTPFVADVSEGKNDPIYNAHSYHTKVPHKAIMPFIKHYTKPGDIVFDGFCGTGMTGVAAQELGRRAILCDISSIASFIAYNYNMLIDVEEFEREARRILAEVEDECGWMYEILHTDGKTRGKINYTVWSDVFICPYCSSEYVLWEAAVDKQTGRTKDEYLCSSCNARITKGQSERATVEILDHVVGKPIIQTKQIPIFISYIIGNKLYRKKPTKKDIETIRTLDDLVIPYWYPTEPLPIGDKTREPIRIGITNVHHFYTKRNLWVLSSIYNHCISVKERRLRHFLQLFFSSLYSRSHRMNRYMPNHNRHVGPLSGTLYFPHFQAEINIIEIAKGKINSFSKIKLSRINAIVSLQSSTSLSHILDNTVDYIFTDPPFGSNIMYSELNYIWEKWFKVTTNNKNEAIINDSQNKSLYEYKDLMTRFFRECYRVIKPNRWITVVFHNSKASIWNAIQDSISKAGFIVAQVAVLDKQKGTTKQLTYAGTVKNDLVINAYKPKKEFEEHFLHLAGEGLEKDFVEEHLDHLPVEINIERTEQMLYSKMLAHYIQRGYEIRMNARQFYGMLRDNFKLIDGFWFNNDQVLDYKEWKKAQGLDKIREIKSGEQLLFISDEKSLLVWLYQYLESPQTYSDIYTASRKIISGVEDDIPELRELLDQNFILENGSYRRPRTREEEEKIETQRQRDLLRSFEKIVDIARSSTKKIKGVRKEALIVGFTLAYQEKRYQDIVDVAKRLNSKIIEENSQINDFVEFARFKTGEDL